MFEERITGKTLFSGRVFDVEVDEVLMENGSRSFREVVRHPGGVGVLAIDADDRAVLVRQYRYAAGREMLEIPAGKLEPGEDPRDAGLRELAEETGYRARKVTDLGYIIPTGGYCSERIYLFLAEDLEPGAASPDEGEYVEPVYMPLGELLTAAAGGEVSDGKTIAALFRAAAAKGLPNNTFGKG